MTSDAAGLTVIEGAVVVVVIAILASGAWPALLQPLGPGYGRQTTDIPFPGEAAWGMRGSVASIHSRSMTSDAAGLTVIELAVVMVVIAILASGAWPSLQRLLQARRLEAAAARLGADLLAARDAARMGRGNVRFTSDAHGWAVQHGTASERHELPRGITLRANVRAIVLDASHGTCSPAGTVRLVSESGAEVRTIVSSRCRIRACAPATC